MLNIFSWACCSFVYLLWRNVCSFIYIVIFLFGCKSYLYNLDTRPLLNIWFTDIFYSSVGCLFNLLILSFEGYYFYFYVFQFIYFVSVAWAFHIALKKLHSIQGHENLFLHLFSNSFKIFAFMCRSMTILNNCIWSEDPYSFPCG